MDQDAYYFSIQLGPRYAYTKRLCEVTKIDFQLKNRNLSIFMQGWLDKVDFPSLPF